ncbi:hypothetical protein PoB_005692800 [Plakobranchus ocellatus]|uniref:Uncharacterized protein n=1 Tax=Plakobranchus ocellatus TaxID=259542 RepID=A0AAV4CG07_9GAST|nr:hypothetical protein PoB_005692800 [Plakobranchus ocellatus]
MSAKLIPEPTDLTFHSRPPRYRPGEPDKRFSLAVPGGAVPVSDCSPLKSGEKTVSTGEAQDSYNSFCQPTLLNEIRGVGGTVASEAALSSAGTLLSRVRAPPSAPRSDGGP